MFIIREKNLKINAFREKCFEIALVITGQHIEIILVSNRSSDLFPETDS